ncbi:MAG: glycosyltransferase [Flavobacteriales bacterium]|nr:glycosyltransferase [Flavobacteriales bacterium]
MCKRIIVSVINDLSSDQRVDRTCATLHEMGYNVLLVGRKMKNSIPLRGRVYKTTRMKLFFQNGALFYAEFNFRLFLFLLFKKFDALHSNDLDTLLANRMAQKFKGGELIYDSHEYFTEVPELIDGSFAKRAWLKIERSILPGLKHVLTVNQSIANIYKSLYGLNFKVMRNLPISGKFNSEFKVKTRFDLGLPSNKKIILLQGAGINVDRGAEEMVEAMKWIDAVFLIVGSGDVIGVLKNQVQESNLSSKVIFTGKVPFEELISYTKIADVGVTLDKDTNLNYKYSLPNKIFDYLQADLPVVASNLIEVRKIVDSYEVGIILSSHEPLKMAEEINNYLNNSDFFNKTKENVQKAKSELIWENEKDVLIKCYESVF